MKLFSGALNGWWETLEIAHFSLPVFEDSGMFPGMPVLPPALAAGHPTAGPAHSSQPSCHLPLRSRNEFLDTIPPTHVFKYIVVKVFLKCFAGISL